MKKIVFLIGFCVFTSPLFAQINLVPNPSFEDTVYCPFGTNQMDACANWLNFGNSPDYFNTCTGFGGPPINYNFGYQNTHSGVGMAGVALYRRPNAPSGPNYREFIGVELTQPCTIGTKYYISFFINCSYKFGVATNNGGLKLSTIPFDSCCRPPLTNSAILYADSIINDSLSWERISASFLSDSAYKYVIIGNFFDDLHTDTMQLGANDGAYYYIDDVCVTTDSIYNESWTGLGKHDEIFKTTVFPNPASSYIKIESSKAITRIEIISTTGILLYKRNTTPLTRQVFDLPDDFMTGLYYLKVICNESFIVKKIIIQP